MISDSSASRCCVSHSTRPRPRLFEEGVHDAELRVEHELPEQADDDRREHHRDQEQRRERAAPAHAARDQVGDREPERRLQGDRAGDEERRRDRALVHDRGRQDVGVVLEADPVVADVAGRRVVREGQQDQPDQRPDREEDQDRHRRRDEQRGEPAVLQPAKAPGGGRRHEPVGGRRCLGRCLKRVGHVVVIRSGERPGLRRPGLSELTLLTRRSRPGSPARPRPACPGPPWAPGCRRSRR